MYKVPVISSDLRHEETIIQAVNALEYLQNLVNVIFNKIDQRIESNNERINNVKLRIHTANEKITHLVGTNKAIQIYSPSKFPATQVFTDIPILFDEKTVEVVSNFKLNMEFTVDSNQEPINQSTLQDKLVFFHVRNQERDKSRLLKMLDEKNGLGKIPRGLRSVNSLILFNTSENPYDSPRNVNFLKKSDSYKSELKLEGSQKIEAAPFSITNRQSLEKKFHQELFYTPKLNDAPEINLPVDLPDLPGIADDVQFEIMEKEKIAPSMFFEDLPVLPDLEIPCITNKPEDSLTTLNVEDPVQIASTILKPPTPPVTLISSLPIHNSDKSYTPEVISNSVALPIIIPPPPPPPPPVHMPPLPPPPPPPLPPASEHQEDKSLEAKKPVAVAIDPRTDLMDAIRKAGGAKGGKLRAAAEISKTKSSEPLLDKGKNTTGNLMNDLHNKLLMRRKGISGSNTDNVSIIDRLSSLIPPPTKVQINSSTSGASDNEDWD